MATQWQTFPIEFRGGLISNLSPLQQGTNAVGSATILQNFEAAKEGGYSKVKGYEKYSNTAVAGSGPILALKIVSGDKTVVSRRNASNVTEYYYGTGTTWTSIGAQALLGGKAHHASHSVTGTEKTIFVDSSNYPVEYDGSDNSLTVLNGSTDLLGSEYVSVFKGTAFYAKGNTLYFSAPLSVGDFSAANGAGSINVASDITGLIVFRDQLIIFTQNSIKRLTGTTSADFVVTPITDRIGCVNGDTIQEVGGDIMYLAPDGIRLLSATDRIGDFALDVASDPIAKDAFNFLIDHPSGLIRLAISWSAHGAAKERFVVFFVVHLRTHLFRQAPLSDHTACDCCGTLDVIRCTRGHPFGAQCQLFGNPPAIERTNLAQ